MDNARAEKSLIEQRFRARVITRARKRNHGNGDTQMHKSDVFACGKAHMEKGPKYFFFSMRRGAGPHRSLWTCCVIFLVN